MAFAQRYPSPPQQRSRLSRPLRTPEHTLGPTFSDEEDGDDSAFIASKMAVLGLDPNGQPYSAGAFGGRASGAGMGQRDTRNQQRQPVHQSSQQQQQNLQHLLQQQALALLESQKAPVSLHAQLQQAQQAQMLAQAQMQLQAQQAFLIQQSQQHGAVPLEQLQYIQQVAQLQQRVQLQQQQNQLQYAMLQQQQQQQQRQGVEDRARMAFDAFQPASANNLQTPPHTAGLANASADWRAPAKSPSPPKTPFTSTVDSPLPGGRFARAAAAAALAASAPEEPTAAPRSTSSTSTEFPPLTPTAQVDKSAAREKLFSSLGNGRPSPIQVHDASRAWSMPATAQLASPQPRASSYAYTGEPVAIVLRQPLGPPGDYENKNFASQIRKKAANNLGMLGRRTPQL